MQEPFKLIAGLYKHFNNLKLTGWVCLSMEVASASDGLSKASISKSDPWSGLLESTSSGGWLESWSCLWFMVVVVDRRLGLGLGLGWERESAFERRAKRDLKSLREILGFGISHRRGTSGVRWRFPLYNEMATIFLFFSFIFLSQFSHLLYTCLLLSHLFLHHY